MSINVNGIPSELKIYKQWVNWKYEQQEEGKKPTKVPYSPRTKYRASVMDVTHWGTFDEAAANVGNGFDGLGFVLTAKDPYCIIDLDAARDQDDYELITKIYHGTRSYTELSPSGTGLHIVTKAELGGRGRKRHPVEVYDRARFITFTGNVQWALPIDYRQAEIDEIIANMPPDAEKFSHHDGMAEPSGTDLDVWNKAASAVNGEKFKDLWNGNFTPYYSSQSEADFALVDIIAFYTQNAAQIKRLFLQSGLGQRDKSKREDYLDKMVRKSFDNIAPPVNVDHIAEMVKTMMQNQAAAAVATEQPAQVEYAPASVFEPEQPAQVVPTIQQPEVVRSYVEADMASRKDELQFPAGLIGDIAEYIYQSSPRPVREISLAAALGLMAGICGSAFNVSNTGLNMYIVVLAQTGTGKEALQGGISRLMENARAVVPSAINFLGAGEFTSPQALVNYMQKKSKNFVSVIGECGMWLKQLSHPNAHERHSGLRRLLLDLYGKSGQRAVYHPTAYADSAKTTESIRQPAVTLLGESTQTKFFECIDETLIAEGFVPRWLIIEYEGDRPPSNRKHAQAYPSQQLMESICNLCTYATQMIEALQTNHVAFTPEAEKLEQEFDIFCDTQINATGEDALRNLWSRVHMKVLKVAALVAVGINHQTPMIDTYCWEYAKNLVLKDTYRMCKRYNSGQLAARIEANNSEQHMAVVEAVKAYIALGSEKTRASYGISEEMYRSFAIPYVYFQRKLNKKPAFDKDRRGSSIAIQKALEEAANTGLLVKVPDTQAKQTFNTSGKLWVISDYKLLPVE